MGVTRSTLPAVADSTYFDYSGALYAAEFGAQGTDGTADDTAELQAAIDAAQYGQPVVLHAGVFRVSTPLVLKQGTVLVGQQASRFAHYQTRTGSSPSGTAIGTVIRAASNFAGDAVIYGQGAGSPGPGYLSGAVRLTRLVIDCRGDVTSSADGIRFDGTFYDPRLENVTVMDAGGHGIHLHDLGDDITGEKTLAPQLISCMVWGSTGNGFDLWAADAYYADCYALSNDGHGFALTRFANTTMVGCRSEWNDKYGYYFTGDIAGGVMNGCITDRNNWDGLRIDGTSGFASMSVTGCVFRRDGASRDTDPTLGNWAAIAVDSCTQPVVITGCISQTGLNDDGSTGISSPKYGLRVKDSRLVTVGNSHFHAITTPIQDDAGNTAFQVGPGVTTNTGTQGATAYDYSPTRARLGIGKVATVPFEVSSTQTNSPVARITYAGNTGTSSAAFNITTGAGTAISTDYALASQVSGDSVDRYRVAYSGKQFWGSGSATRDTTWGRTAAAIVGSDTSDIAATLAGKGFQVKEGSNAKMGTATLVAGTVVVSTTAVTANSRIFLDGQNASGTAGALGVSARTAGTSFTILSTSNTDTRSVAWLLFEPA